MTASADAQCVTCGDAYEMTARPAEIARLEDRFYRRVDYPSRVARLRAEIQYSEAVVDSLERRLNDYGRINRFSTGNALELSAERAELALRREKILIRELREQVLIEQRAYRYHKMAVAYAAQQRFAEQARAAAVPAEEGEPIITIVSH